MRGRTLASTIAAAGMLTACGQPEVVRQADGTPQRVIVLAPAAAEMLDALGLAGRVVAVGEYGPWPESMADRPSVGGYMSPNVELAVALRADRVLTTASEAATEIHAGLEQVGIEVEPLDTSTYDGVFSALERVGQLFEREEQAGRLATELRARLDRIARAASGAPARRVLFVVGRDPLYVAGPGSHLDQMIRLVGGVNVAADAGAPYRRLSLEAVLERRPEIIIDTSDNGAGAKRGRVAGTWGEWDFLPAVRHDRVYQVDPGRLVIPGLRLAEMTELVGKLVQPEIFGEAEPRELD
ncbi:MAG TPA: helical backbone metal receptor [Candidatus Polarisedimenticolaceae bacterium]|nr:helical backbone metal receptor [Candidatus Polarisedimenticolaceae bacterium]